jgi:transcriptional regulator with XRE-family HTH domain
MNETASVQRIGVLNRAFGERVARLREAQNLTQEKLAERVGMHAAYISRLERGTRNPTLVVIGKVARALNVSLAELFSDLQSHTKVAPRRQRRGRPRSKL